MKQTEKEGEKKMKDTVCAVLLAAALVIALLLCGCRQVRIPNYNYLSDAPAWNVTLSWETDGIPFSAAVSGNGNRASYIRYTVPPELCGTQISRTADGTVSVTREDGQTADGNGYLPLLAPAALFALEGIDPKKTVSAHKQPDGLYTVVTEAGVTLTLRHDTEANHFFPVSVSDATRTLSVSDFTVSADTP